MTEKNNYRAMRWASFALLFLIAITIILFYAEILRPAVFKQVLMILLFIAIILLALLQRAVKTTIQRAKIKFKDAESKSSQLLVAEKNLLKNEARLKEAQAITHIGNWEIDLVENITTWSDEFYNIFGVKPEEIQPSLQAFLSMLHPDDYEDAKKTMENSRQSFNPDDFSCRIITANGGIRDIFTEWKFEFDNELKPIRQYGIIQDVTERKIAEEEREKLISDTIQRNRDLEQFTFIISHNLRAPAANIMGIAEILQDETLSPEVQKEFLQGLSTSVLGLDTVIKDINSILQVKQGIDEKKEHISFSRMVEEITISNRHIIEKYRVNIKTDFSEVDEIFSLRVYMHSIFFNLITNSIKYCKPDEEPLISVKSKKENGKLILIFRDNGLGINMEGEGDKVFGLYKRFHSHVQGKGMGLFMVKAQVEAIGGKITLASELNKGTEFTIVFENPKKPNEMS